MSELAKSELANPNMITSDSNTKNRLPRISVVIPAYNEQDFIEASVLSALGQNYPDFEVIVVDNASIDATAERVRSLYRDSAGNLTKKVPLKLIAEKRPGVQFAREAGRQAATGELIANLDADCVAPFDWLSKAAAYFEDTCVVAVTGPYDYHDVSFLMRLSNDFSYKVFRNILHKCIYFCFGLGGLIGGNCVMRASALKQIGGYNTSIAFYGDDTDTGNRLSEFGKILYKNNLLIKSSGRRFVRLGNIRTIWHYTINFFWMLLFKKPYSSINEKGRYDDGQIK
jgi:glycosyltransferase involved in cell wall biosynthesis